MPFIKYTFRHPEGHELTETDYFPKTKDDSKTVTEIALASFNGAAVLTRIEVINPFVHSHSWQRVNKLGEYVYYECSTCGARSHRQMWMFRGGERWEYVLEAAYQGKKWQRCHDKLHDMPPATKMF